MQITDFLQANSSEYWNFARWFLLNRIISTFHLPGKLSLTGCGQLRGDSGRHLRMGAHTKYRLRQDFRKEKTITATTNLLLLLAHHEMTGIKDVIGTILIIPTAFSRIISIIFHS